MTDKEVETRVREVKDEQGNVIERITETWVEKVPMELKNRVVEKISAVPVVLETKLEVYEDGKMVDSKQESLTGMVKVCEGKKEKFKGLADMQDRVSDSMSKKGMNIGLIAIILGLVGYIVYTVVV
jgi:preprotein translocase subunit SecF